MGALYHDHREGTLYHVHREGTRARIYGDDVDIEILYLFVRGTRFIRNAVLKIKVKGEPEGREENMGSRKREIELCRGVKIKKGLEMPPSPKRISIGYEVDKKYQIDFDDSVSTI